MDAGHDYSLVDYSMGKQSEVESPVPIVAAKTLKKQRSSVMQGHRSMMVAASEPNMSQVIMKAAAHKHQSSMI